MQHQWPSLPDVDEGNEAGPGEAVVQLAEALINIESVSGREQRVGKALEGWLQKRGWVVCMQSVCAAQGCESEGARWNVYAQRADCPPSGPRLLLNTHIDTVPPFYSATIDKSKGIIRGRGACDTKSILAAQLLAAQRLVKAGLGSQLGLLFVVSEETDHCGMKMANGLELRPDYLIVGEPTESKQMRVQKGILKVKLSCAGVSCHSGYPHLGKSAIDPLIDSLYELRHSSWPKSEELGDTTLNIGLLKGGHAANALASEAEATLMFRVTCPPNEILEQVQQKVGIHNVEVEVITANAPVRLTTIHGYPTDVASFNTDIPYLRLKEGSTAFLIGPGSIHDAHSNHEMIHIDELREAVNYYTTIMTRLLTK